jgi:hypothetical protein
MNADAGQSAAGRTMMVCCYGPPGPELELDLWRAFQLRFSLRERRAP